MKLEDILKRAEAYAQSLEAAESTAAIQLNVDQGNQWLICYEICARLEKNNRLLKQLLESL